MYVARIKSMQRALEHERNTMQRQRLLKQLWHLGRPRHSKRFESSHRPNHARHV